MKNVLVIGSGISGMTCAVMLAKKNVSVTLISPFPSERSQSVMAAGGINGVTSEHEEGDSVESHIEDTLKGGKFEGERKAVVSLCQNAGNIIDYLERIGTVFSVDEHGRPARRAFGGQSHKRTHYCGSSTGKQIVSALIMEVRRYEAEGLIQRKLWKCFHSALIRNGVCYGALLFDEGIRGLEAVCSDAVVIATGGQNALFGKTTGSTGCDGYTAGKLYEQGVVLKNLEFIQYHPTTIETPAKRMLISEAVRGEGGRLFYEKDGRRVYFMEDKYGPNGNLMTRDVVSREIASAGSQVYLDISFLDKETIGKRLPEVRDLCLKYRGIDITREPIPVAPSVHFFMGGIAVDLMHETNVKNLFAVGECASIYHGANRLGGNSLLAAVHGGMTAADVIAARDFPASHEDFSDYLKKEDDALKSRLQSRSQFPSVYIKDVIASVMNNNLGIVREEASLVKGIENIDYYLSVEPSISYDASVMPYFNYSVHGLLLLSRAVLTCAEFRKESRGAHYRSDFPDTDEKFSHATLSSYDGGKFSVRLDEEGEYEG